MAIDLEKNWPLIIAGLAVVGALFFAVQPGQQSTSYQVVNPSASADPNTAQIQAANLAAAQQTQQLEFGAFGSLVQMAQEEDLAAMQLKDDALKAATGNYQATLQAEVLKTEYADQLAAVQSNNHAATQQSFWNSLFSFGAAAFG